MSLSASASTVTVDRREHRILRAHHGVSDFAARRTRLLALTGLEPFRTRLADRLSGGMKQKLALACVLVHEPPVLVLDEPTTGVDPVSRREFWKLLAEFLHQGLTIVMATPYLDEAERCGRVALIAAGKVLADDEPGRLQDQTTGKLIEVVAEHPRRALEVARAAAGAARVQLFGDRLHVRVATDREFDPVLSALKQAGITVSDWRPIRPTLEDVFIDRLAAESSRPGNRRRGRYEGNVAEPGDAVCRRRRDGRVPDPGGGATGYRADGRRPVADHGRGRADGRAERASRGRGGGA
jgi:ABC-2 type transport system ATP-binding protein